MEFTCPTIAAKLGERNYVLRMDFNALTLAEQITGKNFLDERIWRRLDVTAATALFWACAYQCDSTLKLDEIRSNSYRFAGIIIDAVRRAWRVAEGKPESDPLPTKESEPTTETPRASVPLPN